MSFDLHRSTRRSVAPTGLALALVALGGAAWWSADSSAQIATRPPGVVAPAVPVAGRPAPTSYADAVARVAPAVVTIRVEKKASFEPTSGQPDDFFRRFFGERMPSPERQPRERGLGSGVIISQDGRILTNAHVVDGADSVRVILTNGREYTAKVIGVDKPTDLAVIDVEATGLPTLPLGNSDVPRVGDVVLAVGNPLGVGQTVTMGILSAKGRTTGTGDSYEDFLQTDAPINQGNSGGALVNTRGELVGINSQILSPNGGGNIGIGFAIPSNMAKTVMGQLIGKGKVNRGMLGVTIQPVTSDLAQGLGLKETRGVAISSVSPGGPAERAGLKQGDVILQINGKTVNDPNELRNTVAAMSPGADVTVTVSRIGAEPQGHVKLGELGSETAQSGGGGGGGGGAQGGGTLGVGVVPLTPDLASQLGLRRGTQGVVVQSVDPNGAAAQVGIQAGDVIQEVNRQPVRTPEEMRSALQKSGNHAPLLLVNRGGQSQYVPVPLQ
jgi:serine protease Do